MGTQVKKELYPSVPPAGTFAINVNAAFKCIHDNCAVLFYYPGKGAVFLHFEPEEQLVTIIS
jgi:hypothetical protein